MAGNLLVQMRDGRELTKRQQIQLICTLSMPAILAQISSIVMQYIDASMVGSLGAQASASIGLVSTSIWLFGGICGAVSSGFSIQAAHCIGAGDTERARSVMRQSFSAACLVSALLVVCGFLIADKLPAWLGASPELHRGASQYFTVFVCAIPVVQINRLAGGMLQSSGNMRTPGMLNIMMCMLDVVFNGILIFPSREIMIAGMPVTIPGFGMGVVGAALGTALAQLVTATLMTGYLWFRSDLFRIRRGECWRPERSCICHALCLALPIGLENVMMCGAMYVGAPFMMALLTPEVEIQRLGIQILRIEVFAEPLYAASIVASGALRGTGDTMIPSMMNFFSIWCVRIPLAVILAASTGLRGVWIAMCLELCFRGTIFLVRLYREKWLMRHKA